MANAANILQLIAANWYAVLAVLLVFGFMIVVHEFGHFIVAKIAGPAMNYVAATLLFCFLTVFFGVPEPNRKLVVNDPRPGMPAALAGLRTGDRIVALEIGGKKVEGGQEIIVAIHKSEGREITLFLERDGNSFTEKVRAVKNTEKDSKGKDYWVLGFTPDFEMMFRKVPLPLAIKKGPALTWEITERHGTIVAGIFSRAIPLKTVSETVTGPIGIVRYIFRFAKEGLPNLIFLGGFLNIAIALFNLVPFPALDGGRLLFLGIAAIRRKSFDPEKEGMAHLIGFAILILLVVLISINDVGKLLRGKWF
ncbi:MAG: site-2 protease family protein [Armatimonadetes bacterium]|nr:site-2 protease family protein [Armatimonadota bacterium]